MFHRKKKNQQNAGIFGSEGNQLFITKLFGEYFFVHVIFEGRIYFAYKSYKCVADEFINKFLLSALPNKSAVLYLF